MIVLDIALPGKSGVEWLHELREGGFLGDVVLITAFADIETAISALRGGASDFILKPFRLDQILNSIQRCFERARLARENYVLKRQVRELAGVEGLIGVSEAIREVSALIQRIAPMPSTVLIEGESGTGKEVAARALHRLSPRAGRPFVPVNCAAIPSTLIETELFGHVKGAFTDARSDRNGLFYYAQGGTLFLDEIGELPLPMQTKLLRVLEERKIRPVGSEREVPVDVRIIAASNRSLAPEVAAGRFRPGPLLSPRRGKHRPAAAARPPRGRAGARTPLHRAACAAVGCAAAAGDAGIGSAADGLFVAGQRAGAAQPRRARPDPRPLSARSDRVAGSAASRRSRSRLPPHRSMPPSMRWRRATFCACSQPSAATSPRRRAVSACRARRSNANARSGKCSCPEP